jgi:hypothetical protein
MSRKTPPSGVAVEHSEEDTESPHDTPDVGAVEHDPESTTDPAPTDEVDAQRAADIDRLYTEALAEVATTRESTPPMKGVTR